MSERDDELEAGRRYAALPKEAPPDDLDAAIRLAAHAAVRRRSPRWAVPVAAAAVLALAVALTGQLERDEAEPLVAVAPAPAPQEAAAQAERKERKAEAFSGQGAAPERRSQPMASAAAPSAQDRQESPEQWLERVARLRAQGRHEEADKALAEFRRRHPQYRIPLQTLEKVERK